MENKDFINQEMIDEIVQKLANNQPIRRNIAKKGRLNIDRPLPFLCVYRKPKQRSDKGTAHLILGEAAYLISMDEMRESRQNVTALVESVSKTLADKFGAFLIIEVWAAQSEVQFGSFTTDSKAKFRIFTDKTKELPSTIASLKESLEFLELSDCQNEVEIVAGEQIAPPKMKPLLNQTTILNLSCLLIGLEISPIYRDAETGEIYLSILRDLRRKLSNALQQTFFEFVHVQTPERPTRPQMLGRRSVVDAVWSADAELSALSDKFNYLMAVTPVNSSQAYKVFKKKSFEK